MDDLKSDGSISSSERFISLLHEEKQLHKEQRHKHVLHKLLLTGTFFGLGQFADKSTIFQLFLYMVPLIALVHDLYIFAEHAKVQRIGKFLRENKESLKDIICKEEILWEEWLEENSKKNRERLAFWASLLYTLVISVWTAYIIYYMSKNTLLFSWMILWMLGILTVFLFGAGFQLTRGS